MKTYWEGTTIQMRWWQKLLLRAATPKVIVEFRKRRQLVGSSVIPRSELIESLARQRNTSGK